MSRAVICECFARDGLQHEDRPVPTAAKIAAIDAFTDAGFPRIEATSYSHPGQVPAFADASETLAGIRRGEGVHYKATVPNMRGLDRAIADLDAGRGATEVSLLLSATESHSRKNLRRGREAQWQAVEEMAARARDRFRVIGVISVAFGCPFEGAVDPGSVMADVARFHRAGVRYVAICDTTGLATPAAVKSMFGRVAGELPEVTAIAHFHDTRGTGIANCVAALEAGCTHFDSAFGGVGGHPQQIRYGGGYTGNVCTEDLVNLLESLGVPTGLDLDRVAAASRLCESILGRELDSMVARTGYGLIPGRPFETQAEAETAHG
jgi:hydroxymethylglutaryl-CoA lyase